MLRCCFGGQPTRAARTASGNCNLSGGAIVIDDEDWSYSYTLKIAGYSRTKELLETGKYARSTPFTVGGHVWAVRYYPNGYKDAADFASIFLVLVDSTGAKDVKAKCTFSVLDEAGLPVPSFTRTYTSARTFTGKDSSWGYPEFINKADLEGSPHLIDDCFAIRCDVTVLKENRSEEIKKCSKQFVVVPPSNLRRQLSGLLNSMDGADVTFHVGGDKFPAHRSVLAARSSVFKAELLGSMKENAGDPLVEIKDMESDVFKSLLHFIYTDDSPSEMACEDAVMAGHLLVAADRYDVERLKLICEDKLCKHIDSNTVATSLALAEQHSCPGLKEACFGFLASPSNFEAMVASDGYEHLKSSCPSVLKELIARFLPAELKAAKDIIMKF
ncbi:hypothetical protein CFC21_107648 [Triticum aestivum]|uniref:Uncharacterized protein n=2 Tax=Triticum aestivum TaxID=4565 RepID=A0A9R1NAU3_WHEAT|nr:BTB/POZ and MATH domain-containing protein 2-like [Triticum aestivum]KAF7106947.1 hypothetical protein CFC21_107648 [Triticum aestivum]